MISAKWYEDNCGQIIIEQCTPQEWCQNLKTFLMHVEKDQKVWGMTERNKAMLPEDCEVVGYESMEHSLVYKMPAKKGSAIRLWFCPFCGGPVDDGPTTFLYRPYTEEDEQLFLESQQEPKLTEET